MEGNRKLKGKRPEEEIRQRERNQVNRKGQVKDAMLCPSRNGTDSDEQRWAPDNFFNI
jgi:hypothetical protein